VTPSGDIRIIEGGTQQGANLFHSFREFSFSNQTPALTGSSVNFNNDLGIKNIITRVTGGQASTIDGLIKANGGANLFLINPQGIIFGKNASLDIGGSFIGSTANSIKFLDGSEYSAVSSSQPNQLLTVSTPIGLQFGSNSGAIVNQSQASIDGAIDVNGLPAGLQVKSGRTLALLGSSVSLQNGNLTAGGGRVELGAVMSNDIVNLRETEEGYVPNYSNLINFGDIQILDASVIDTSGENGGAIQIHGKNINITDSSQIISVTLGSIPGKNILINASDSVNITQGGSIATFANSEGVAGDVSVQAQESISLTGTTPDSRSSSIASQVTPTATGKGGNLNIQAKRLFVRDGAIIDSSTFGFGQAGNISVKTSEFVQIIGTDTSGLLTSGIFSQVAEGAGANAGSAGSLNLETSRLIVQDGGQISSATFSGGNGGNVTIKASDSILLSGASLVATRNKYRSGIFVSAEPGATGNAGELNIATGKLTVEDKAEISANNFAPGKGGTATLNVGKLIVNNGGEIRASSFSEGSGGELNIKASDSINISGLGTIDDITFPSILSSSASGTGNAGNLIINSPNFNIRDGGEVTVSGKGTGAAGNLTANSRNIRLNAGKITAETNGGEGANVNLQNVKLLTLQNQSLISAQAFNSANGGNIDVDAKNGFIVAYPNQNNDIIASAFEGNGGKINITAQSIFNLSDRLSNPSNITNDIDASSQFGTSGTVNIETPDVDPSNGLLLLPSVFADTSNQLNQICNPKTDYAQNSFTITGRGSVTPNPLDALSGDLDLTPLATLPENNSSSAVGNYRVTKATNSSVPKIVEAQGWIKKDGEIYLVENVASVNPHSSWQNRFACH
jgi:filamentous hemagglutinin family protein